MNNSCLMKVGRTRHDVGELKVIKDHKSEIRRESASVLTNSKRFASGLDLVYSTTFPFFIQSETMRKCWGSMETETPNKGRMFGWDSHFQHMISRQNRYV